MKGERTASVSLWKQGHCVYFLQLWSSSGPGRQRYLLGYSDPDSWQPARVHYTGTSNTTLKERLQLKINLGFVAKRRAPNSVKKFC